MKKEGRYCGCRESKKVYQRKNKSLENCAKEGGIRGERLGVRKDIFTMSQRTEDLVQ
jgi:hypothetical protein